MKKYILIFITAAFIAGCSTQDMPKGVSSRAVAVLVDFSDKRSLWFTPNPCLSLYDFSTDPQAEAWFRMTEISDKRINQDYVVHLPTAQVTEKGNEEFPQHRNICINSFYDSVRRTCTDMYSRFDTTKTIGHSEIFAAVCQQIRWLENKHCSGILLVFSNLIEHSEIANAFKIDGENSVAELTDRFEATHLMPKQLSGITVFFVNAPMDSAEDRKYSIAIAAYQKLIEARGGKVVIQANNTNYLQ